VWPRGARAEDVAGLHVLPGGAPLAEVPVFRLIESLERVLSRAEVTFTHDVVVDRVSLADKIHELVERLEREGTFTFESLLVFADGEPLVAVKQRLIITFLAILEMTRLALVRLTQAESHGAIYVSRAAHDLRAEAETLRHKLRSEDQYK
jgi:segregation and condensation protein A